MSKTKKTSEDKPSKAKSLFSEIAKKTGGEILGDIPPVKYYVDTGNLALNFINSGRFMGGGIPGGRITEIYGPSASSKTLIGTNIVRGAQALGGYAIYLDCENALNSEFAAKASHLDVDTIIRYTPETLERVFNKIHAVLRLIREKDKDVPVVFVYDSISVSPCEREFRETTLTENYTQAEFKKKVGAKEQPGERARVCSSQLRKLNPVLANGNASLVVINQTRQKIGVLYGNPETTGGGGTALEFYASCRIRTQSQKKIENKKLGTFIGVNVKMTNKKNRSFAPFWECDGVQLFFKDGINPLGGLFGCLIKAERVAATKPGYYKVCEPWAGGVDHQFRASKEKGEMDLDTLLKFPSLVDAKNEQEIKDYLAIFGDAIRQTASEDVQELEVGGETWDDDPESSYEDPALLLEGEDQSA
jgi:recombination protein RecA